MTGEIAASYQSVLFIFAVEGRTDEFLEAGVELQKRAIEVGELLTAARLLAWMACAAGWAGRLLETEEYAAKSTRLFHEVGVAGDAMLAIGQAIVGHLTRDFAGARRVLGDFIDMADETGRTTDALWARTILAQTLVYAQLYEEAEVILARAISDSETSGELHVRNWLYADKVFCRLAAGDVGEAERFAGQAMSSGAEAVDEIAVACLASGCVLTAQDRVSEAEAAFRGATEVLKDTELNSFRTDISLAWSRLLIDTGRPDEARPMLEEARSYGYWRDEIEVLLSALPG